MDNTYIHNDDNYAKKKPESHKNIRHHMRNNFGYENIPKTQQLEVFKKGKNENFANMENINKSFQLKKYLPTEGCPVFPHIENVNKELEIYDSFPSFIFAQKSLENIYSQERISAAIAANEVVEKSGIQKRFQRYIYPISSNSNNNELFKNIASKISQEIGFTHIPESFYEDFLKEAEKKILPYVNEINKKFTKREKSALQTQDDSIQDLIDSMQVFINESNNTIDEFEKTGCHYSSDNDDKKEKKQKDKNSSQSNDIESSWKFTFQNDKYLSVIVSMDNIDLLKKVKNNRTRFFAKILLYLATCFIPFYLSYCNIDENVYSSIVEYLQSKLDIESIFDINFSFGDFNFNGDFNFINIDYKKYELKNE